MTDSIIITKEHLGTIAKSVLEFLDERVESLSDLKGMINQTFLINEDTKGRILVKLRPSNLGTIAYTISYVLPGKGIPLEVRLNKRLGYSKIIVKGDFTLPGYKPFTQYFGNTVQDKRLKSTDILQIKSELETLVNYQ